MSDATTSAGIGAATKQDLDKYYKYYYKQIDSQLAVAKANVDLKKKELEATKGKYAADAWYQQAQIQLEQQQTDLKAEVDRGALALNQEIQRGTLDLNRAKMEMDNQLQTGRLDLDRVIETGKLGLEQGQLGVSQGQLEVNRGQLDVNRGQLGVGQGQLGLDYLKQAASLGGPSDYYQYLDFASGARRDPRVANWLGALEANQAQPSFVGPGPESMRPPAQSMPTLTAGLGGAATGGQSYQITDAPWMPTAPAPAPPAPAPAPAAVPAPAAAMPTTPFWQTGGQNVTGWSSADVASMNQTSPWLPAGYSFNEYGNIVPDALNTWKNAGMPGFAAGGRPAVGRPIVVGERGPEVVVLSAPGYVIPNNQARRLGAAYLASLPRMAAGGPVPSQYQWMLDDPQIGKWLDDPYFTIQVDSTGGLRALRPDAPYGPDSGTNNSFVYGGSGAGALGALYGNDVYGGNWAGGGYGPDYLANTGQGSVPPGGEPAPAPAPVVPAPVVPPTPAPAPVVPAPAPIAAPSSAPASVAPTDAGTTATGTGDDAPGMAELSKFLALGPVAWAPQAIESLTPSQRDLLYSAARKKGYDLKDMLEIYDRSRFGQATNLTAAA